jgi:phosphate transport system substrate-binding protein
MKRLFCLSLALVMVLLLAACQTPVKPAPDPTNAPNDTPSSDPTAAPTDAPTDAPSASRPSCALEDYPNVDGSTANIPMAMSLVQLVTGCTEAEAEATIHFSTTDYSYDALNEGRADMLLVYEASKPTKEKLDPEHAFDMRPIGLDALVFIVNKDNPVENLTLDQIRGIYSGEIKNWKEVGGNDIEIQAFQRPVLSGSQTLMLDLVMGEIPMAPVEEITVSSTMADVITDIAAYDSSANAIGYSVYYYAQNMYNQPNLKFVAVDGVTPSFETINSAEYPFINPFYAILPRSNANPMAQAIVDWLETRDGQEFVKSCGYVPYMKLD